MGSQFAQAFRFLMIAGLLLSGLSPGADDVIVDNGQAGTSFTGTWSVSAGTGSYGENSLWGRAGATYTWQTDQLTPGFYEVFMWWTQYTSRTDAAPVAVNYAGGTESLTINQQVNGSVWNSLGTYYFTTTGSVTITGMGVFPVNTCADAVRFTRTDTPPPSFGTIIDNTDAATAKVGTWLASGATGAYGTDSVYCRARSCSFSWLFTPEETAYYNVYMWWTEFSSRSAVAPVEIETADGLETMTVNQQTNGGMFNLLGEYFMNAGTTYRVTIRTLTDLSSISADAVAFSKTSTPPPPPPPPAGTIVDNTDPNTQKVGTWPVSGALDPYGTNSVYCRTANCSFSWLFTPEETAYYNVYMYWTEFTSRSAVVPVDIINAAGTASLTVNQQTNCASWNLLGEYLFEAGMTYRVTVRTLADMSSICADAVCFGKTDTPPPPPSTDVIIDNTSTATERVGSWTVSGGTGAYGTNSLYCRNASSSFSWLFTPAETGYYELSMWWTEFSSRSAAAPVTIETATGTQAVTVNQQTNGGKWNVLGTYEFTGGTTYRVTIRTLADMASICADAVKFAETTTPPPPPTSIVIDNTDAATSMVGTWPVSGGAGAYGTNSFYCRTADSSFSWLFTPETTGSYKVSMWWTEFSSRSAAAPVEIQHAGGMAALTVNQQTNGSKWNLLGTYVFNGGTTYLITIRTLADMSSICADAVQFEKVEIQADVIIDNGDPETVSVGTWPVSGAPTPYGEDSVYCRDANSSYTWRFTPPSTGLYEVSMWWTVISSRSPAAPVEIQHASGTAVMTVDQLANGGMWNVLGEYQFQAGITYNITVRTLTDRTSICADAVRLAKIIN